MRHEFEDGIHKLPETPDWLDVLYMMHFHEG